MSHAGPCDIRRQVHLVDGVATVLAVQIRAAFEGLALGGATRQMVAAAMAAVCRCVDSTLSPPRTDDAINDIPECGRPGFAKRVKRMAQKRIAHGNPERSAKQDVIVALSAPASDFVSEAKIVEPPKLSSTPTVVSSEEPRLKDPDIDIIDSFNQSSTKQSFDSDPILFLCKPSTKQSTPDL